MSTPATLPDVDEPLLDEVVPPGLQSFFMGLPGLSWVRKQPEERRDLIAIALFAAALFFPYLGAVGLWDPWEPHYGEVAREMVWRHDYVNPWWQSANFYSKPPLLMWLMTIGMNLLDINAIPATQELPRVIEWFMRAPVALMAIAGVVMLCMPIRRVMGRRVGFLTAFVLVTSPFYFFLARQCMEDMPLVACVEAAIGCFLMAELTRDPNDAAKRASPFWWYAMYAMAGLATLAKESLGIALPGLIIFGYLLISWDWGMLKRARLLPGALTFAVIGLPWYGMLLTLSGHDDEFKTFGERLWWDNVLRLQGQVHSTTPGWDFTYYIEQLGWGFFPWVALIPAAIVAVSRTSRTSTDAKSRLTMVFASWAVLVFAFFTASGTKFHHYIFPVLPALAFLVALAIDQIWREGISQWFVPVLGGVAVYGLVANNLAVWHLDNGQVQSGLKHLTDLFVYQYQRPYPFGMDNVDLFQRIAVLGGAAVAASLVLNQKKWVFMSFGALAVAVGIWGSWFYWRWMSPHWAQRDEFWAIYSQSKPNEPITGFILGEGWRGETFYGRNRVREMNDATHLQAFVQQPGPEFVIVEQARLNVLKQALPGYNVRVVDQSSNKFYLVEVE
jgi:4-amino-4-deoxy-L-arabinose transferase-like glycosyltransferase